MALPVGVVAPESSAQPPSDVALLERIAAGETQALWELSTRHAAALRELALALVHDVAAADRVVQTVFQEVRYQAAHFDPAHFPVLRWLMEMTRAAALEDRAVPSGR
jgi:DNA-directed RNA polymerase specialized sigma24 family protein